LDVISKVNVTSTTLTFFEYKFFRFLNLIGEQKADITFEIEDTAGLKHDEKTKRREKG